MRYGVLGTLMVTDDNGVDHTPGGERQRLLLATLLAAAGGLISADRLVDELWSDALPANPAGALQNQISRLRGALGAVSSLRTEGAGYRFVLDSGALDAEQFEHLLAAAGRRRALDPPHLAGPHRSGSQAVAGGGLRLAVRPTRRPARSGPPGGVAGGRHRGPWRAPARTGTSRQCGRRARGASRRPSPAREAPGSPHAGALRRRSPGRRSRRLPSLPPASGRGAGPGAHACPGGPRGRDLAPRARSSRPRRSRRGVLPRHPDAAASSHQLRRSR